MSFQLYITHSILLKFPSPKQGMHSTVTKYFGRLKYRPSKYKDFVIVLGQVKASEGNELCIMQDQVYVTSRSRYLMSCALNRLFDPWMDPRSVLEHTYFRPLTYVAEGLCTHCLEIIVIEFAMGTLCLLLRIFRL